MCWCKIFDKYEVCDYDDDNGDGDDDAAADSSNTRSYTLRSVPFSPRR